MTKEEYKQKKIKILALPAAVILLVVQLVVFMSGLHVGWDGLDWLLGAVLWGVLLAVQLIGNDMSWKDDRVFFFGWLFSYVVEISAGTWTFYGVFDLPNEYIRWSLAFGVSGMVALFPERLILLWANSRGRTTPKAEPIKKPPVTPAGPMKSLPPKPAMPRRDILPKANNWPPKNEPTYRPLNGRPNFNEEDA